jgi:hypothetical protein
VVQQAVQQVQVRPPPAPPDEADTNTPEQLDDGMAKTGSPLGLVGRLKGAG